MSLFTICHKLFFLVEEIFFQKVYIFAGFGLIHREKKHKKLKLFFLLPRGE